jgi:proline iminopeptidase
MTRPEHGGDGLYPPIDAFSQINLPVSANHKLYVEQSGNPHGFPVLFLHGGPGSQTNPDHRRYFDPQFYHIVLFDQRGCGRSTPRGGIEQNTTWQLVEDIEQIRKKLNVNRFLLFGGSWGSTLALAYAITYPQCVAGMILRGVFLASDAELDWYVNGLRRFIPAAWERFAQGRASSIVARYQRDVNHGERPYALAAARRWVEYELSVMGIGGAAGQLAGNVDEEALLARARVQLHYLAAGCFLGEGQLMQRATGLGVPTIIVQGRADMVCPPVTAYELSQRLADSELRMVEQAGHLASGPLLAPALRNAADDMRERLAELP